MCRVPGGLVHDPGRRAPAHRPAKLVVASLEQIVWLAPTVTTATLCTVTTTCADWAVQDDWLPVEVSVSVTVPVEASASDGV